MFSKAFWSGAAIGVVLVVLFWLFGIGFLFIVAAVFVMLGPAAGIIAAIALLGLCFLTLHRVLRRFRASREATIIS